ncbi:MAG: RNA polymerase sigma factor [Thermoanaerobaculia bacterium]
MAAAAVDGASREGPGAVPAPAAGSPLALTLGEEEFEGFYARTSPGLWAYLRRLGGDAGVADDVLQESYLKFLHRVDSGRDERERRGYLYRIATTLLHDRWRRERRERSLLERLFSVRTERVEDRGGADRVDLEAELQTLKPRERALVWLAYVEGYEHREIAAILGLNEASVRVMLFRVRKKLAGRLDPARKEVER